MNPIDHSSDATASQPTNQKNGLSTNQLLSGRWDMEIVWHRAEATGKASATAVIRETPLGIDMKVHSPGSDSHTILAHPNQELSGATVLHYIYQVEPKAIWPDAHGSYKGAAILRLDEYTGELSGNYWTDSLSRGHFKLNRRIERTETVKPQAVDVLLIAALEEELSAAVEVFSTGIGTLKGVQSWDQAVTADGDEYQVGDFEGSGGTLFRIALARPTRMGSIRTGGLATTLTDLVRPRCLVMCGVCAGNPKDMELGDVVISELTYQYDEGKKEAERFVGDHRQVPISKRWLKASQALKTEGLPSFGPPSDEDRTLWLLRKIYQGISPATHPARTRYVPEGTWKTTMTGLETAGLIKAKGNAFSLTKAGTDLVNRSMLMDVDPPRTLPFAIKTGPIASGNVVVKDGVTWERLAEMGVRSVLGLEMEAATIGEVANTKGVAEYLVVKGVMDHADANKADRFKAFAARASAEVLLRFLIDRFLDHQLSKAANLG
ncbi:hypothetical protein [Rhizobium giardinii]|uniref:Nucleoside phosphorylase n=1 Tax=Rhizobium giardinii TaxID=56731 RepID=A0A7W8XA70_9HYPH|nr:hypothetical protein [Rhizobium giardinii]MBB5539090.1 nucleoside phosphorylase [Rhizobium giardinii]